MSNAQALTPTRTLASKTSRPASASDPSNCTQGKLGAGRVNEARINPLLNHEQVLWNRSQALAVGQEMKSRGTSPDATRLTETLDVREPTEAKA